jgi:RsiW-degrading membrane proteinase PrsW (M82 family)
MYFVILAFIAIATSLVWYLLRHDHGRKLPVGSLWIACGFGIVAMAIAIFVERLVLPSNFTTAPETMSRGSLLLGSLAVGLIEETAKFLPLALFIYKKPYFKEHTDGVIYFAICGLTFALVENIGYTLQFGGQTGIGRLIMTPFFHAATAGVLGYYLASYKINKLNLGKLVCVCFAMPLLHGLYDFGLSTGAPMFALMSMIITLCVSISLFLYFGQANDLDRAALATVPIAAASRFCSRCGRQNINNKKFCESCGNNL